jgi:hypothetical protein
MKKFTILTAMFLCTAWMAYGQWTYTSLSEPKSDMGYVSLGNKAYFAGGYNGSQLLSEVESYDVVTGTWETIGNLSVARQWPTAVACGTKLFFAGGMNFAANVVFNTVDIYDTQTHQWEVKHLSVARFDVAAVSYGTKVLFAGGVTFPYNTFSIVDIYDVATGEWLPSANLTQQRCGIARAVVGDLAIFAGGSVTSSTTSDRVDIYNFTTNTWTSTTLSQARFSAIATTVGNKVVIGGGCTAMQTPSSRVDIYDATINTWSTSALSVGRAWLGTAATVNGHAYFPGGGNFNYGFNSPTDVIDIWDEASGTWATEALFEPLHSHAMLGVGDYLVVGGGINGANERTALVQIFHDRSLILVPEDYSLIQEGINASSDGDTVLVSEDTYYENINYFGKAILLASEFIMDGDTNHINNTIINGSEPVNPDLGSVVTFFPESDTTSVLCGFTITAGTGTLVAAAGNARLGGGVFFGSGGKLINNHIEYNTISNEGWASGGGIFAGGPLDTLPWVVLRNNRITNNKAISSTNQGTGGGIEIWFNLLMEINQLSWNEASGSYRGDGGGARISGNFGHIDISVLNNVFTHNIAKSNSTSTDLVISGGLDIFLDCSGTVSHNTVSFNEIEVAEGKWGYGTGVLVEMINAQDFVFENNIITSNIFSGDSCMGGGLLVYDANGKYQNNVVQYNQGTNGGGVGIGGTTLDYYPIFINNTITGNEATYGGGLWAGVDAAVINTIIWDNTATEGASIFAVSALEVLYSDVEGDEVWPGEGNMNEEPEFDNDGYHLSQLSPLVDEGIESILVNGVWYNCPAYDIDGEARPYPNSSPEIGVDEVQPVGIYEPVSANRPAISIFPNPADRELTISVEEGTSISSLNIYDLAGKKVCTGLPTGNILDVSALQPGIYFIEIISDLSKTIQKLIIQ